MLKTKKLVIKRIKITKNKKVLHRACGQNHFNARDSGKITKKKRRDKILNKRFSKIARQNV
jgi:ribosomal protein L35